MSRFYEMSVEVSGHDPGEGGRNPSGSRTGVAV